MAPNTTNGSALWFEEPDQDKTPGWWARYWAWIWATAIVVVVMGIGAWNVITNGPIHPHV